MDYKYGVCYSAYPTGTRSQIQVSGKYVRTVSLGPAEAEVSGIMLATSNGSFISSTYLNRIGCK